MSDSSIKPISGMELMKCEEFCRRQDNDNIKFSILIGAPDAVKVDGFCRILE